MRPVMGDQAWGEMVSHLCQFYRDTETALSLLTTLKSTGMRDSKANPYPCLRPVSHDDRVCAV